MYKSNDFFKYSFCVSNIFLILKAQFHFFLA